MTNEVKRYELTDCGTLGNPWREMRLDDYGDWVRYEDLLATRRALKMAQAKALRALGAWFVERNPDESPRAERLLNHYAAKFEREAKEMGND